MTRSSVPLLTLAALVLLGGCDRQSAPGAQQREADPAASLATREAVSRAFAGEGLPRFTVKDASGRTLDLASLAGQPVLLNLWATWCAPCKAEMPVLDAIAAEHAGRLRVVTVSQDSKGAEAVAPFFAEGGFRHLEPWLDPRADLSFSMKVGDMPTTFLYDARGREIARVTGAYDWEGEEARALIAEAIGS